MSERDDAMEASKLIEDQYQMADFVMEIILGGDSAKTSRFILTVNAARFDNCYLAKENFTILARSIAMVKLADRCCRLYARMPATAL